MATNPGKKFEHDVQESAKKNGIFIKRLNDTSLSWQHERTSTFTPKNISDFIIYQYPNLFFVECKSTTYSRMAVQRSEKEPDAMIKFHQLKGLMEASQEKGILCGFLLNFRNDEDINDNITYWIDIRNMWKFLENSDKKSINKNDCGLMYPIVVEQSLRRTHYDYDINKLLEDIKRREESNG